MQWTDVLGLIGGLALFLYGMKMMSSGLELLAGSRLKSILEKITSNKYLGMLVGAGIAAVIQSSNATIVMTCSFVNAGLMSLNQAVGVIIGAKIGTTMTGQLLSLKIDQFAPVIAMVGVVMMMFLKKKFINHLGQVIAGLGILFMGMSNLSGSMSGLKDVPEVGQFLSFISGNPLLGVLVGTVFTAIIQSSTASVAVLQTIYQKGLISFSMATNVIYGQNIGTCITALIASINGDLNSKRLTLIHILINLIGAIIFLITSYFIPFIDFVSSLTSNYMMQIAYMHVIFNIVSTIIFLPFDNLLINIVYKIIPNKENLDH